MTKVNKNSRLTMSESKDNKETIGDQTTKPFPSQLGCGECHYNMHTESINNSKANESLSSKDKITNLDKEIYRFESIHYDFIKNHIIELKKLKQIEVDKVAKSEAAKLLRKTKAVSSEDDLKKITKMTTFNGNKGDFVKKAAHHYFNENNPFGVHLSKLQISNIAKMLCEHFKSEDGTLLNFRTTKAGLKYGFNMDAKGDISFK